MADIKCDKCGALQKEKDINNGECWKCNTKLSEESKIEDDTLEKLPSLGSFYYFSISLFITHGVSSVFIGYTLFTDSSYINEYFLYPLEAILFGTILLTVSYGLIIKKYWSIILLGIAIGCTIIRSIFLILSASNASYIVFSILFIIVKVIWFDYFYQRKGHFKK